MGTGGVNQGSHQSSNMTQNTPDLQSSKPKRVFHIRFYKSNLFTGFYFYRLNNTKKEVTCGTSTTNNSAARFYTGVL